MPGPSRTEPFRVAALYCFVPVTDPAGMRDELLALAEAVGVRGTLILAPEGINGTIAGSAEAVDAVVALARRRLGGAGWEIKYSEAAEMPFLRTKVRVKKEIVTLGVPGIDAAAEAGTRVGPAEWNALLADPATVVVDTRNGYEVGLGSFEGAVDPGTETFRDFPAWVDANRDRLEGRRIAMFCTGGIRCEKATALMRRKGFDEVYHLDGGILRYLAEVEPEQSRWRGECFVFDERVSVTHGLAEGDASLCRACRRPLTAGDRASPFHVEGIACVHCRDERDEAARARYAERMRQVELAELRGAPRHIGAREVGARKNR